MRPVDGTKIAYFRGRKLQGKTIKLPTQCRGVVVERKNDEAPPAEAVVDVEDGDDTPERVGSMQVTAEFDEMVVWEHENMNDSTGDPYIRGMEEWLQVADQVRSGLLKYAAFVLTCTDPFFRARGRRCPKMTKPSQ